MIYKYIILSTCWTRLPPGAWYNDSRVMCKIKYENKYNIMNIMMIKLLLLLLLYLYCVITRHSEPGGLQACSCRSSRPTQLSVSNGKVGARARTRVWRNFLASVDVFKILYCLCYSARQRTSPTFLPRKRRGVRITAAAAVVLAALVFTITFVCAGQRVGWHFAARPLLPLTTTTRTRRSRHYFQLHRRPPMSYR